MTDQLVTYAIMRTMYEQGREISEIVEAFVLECLNDEFQGQNAIRKAILRRHNFHLPNAQIAQVFGSLRKRSLVEMRAGKARFAPGSSSAVNLRAQAREFERELNSLITDGLSFLQEKGFHLKRQEFEHRLDSFFRENIQDVLETLDPSTLTDDTGDGGVSSGDTVEHRILEYLAEVERSRPNHFATVEKMASGALLSLLLRPEHVAEVKSAAKRHSTFFADTNFVLHLLGLNGQDAREAAEEVRDLLATSGFPLAILDISIAEAQQLLCNYTKHENDYVDTLEVDHIYSRMKKLGWTGADAFEFAAKLRENLEGMGISTTDTGINLQTFQPSDPMEFDRIGKYGAGKTPHARVHDMAAIHYIRTLRGRRVAHFSNATAFFLTTDRGLTKFNHVEGGHSGDRTIVEVMLASTAANIVWMQNPGLHVPIKALVAANLGTGLVNQRLWASVKGHLKQLALRTDDGQDALEALLYDNFLQGELEGYAPRDALDEDAFADIVERAKAARTQKEGEREAAHAASVAAAKADATAWMKRFEEVTEREGAALASQAELRHDLLQERTKRRQLQEAQARERTTRVCMAYRLLAGADAGLVALVIFLSIDPLVMKLVAFVASAVVAVVGLRSYALWQRVERAIRRYYMAQAGLLRTPSARMINSRRKHEEMRTP